MNEKIESVSKSTQKMLIHVFDESKNAKKDFICERDLLIKEMRYFEEHLTDETGLTSEDVNISIHCDILIFEWLIKYIRQKHMVDKDSLEVKLDISNVVPILVSSNFLKMTSLIDECVEYLSCNMDEVLSGSTNMNCIDDNIIQKIAKKLSAIKMDSIIDKKNKIKGRLFLKKIEQLFLKVDNDNEPLFIFQCLFCQKHLTNASSKHVLCLPNRLHVSKHGDLMPIHVINPNFKIFEFISSLKSQLKLWSQVYWSIYGLITLALCSHCNAKFRLCDLRGCCYHSEEPIYKAGELTSVLPCCGSKCTKFEANNFPIRGCRVKDHLIDNVKINLSDEVSEVVARHSDDFTFFADNPLIYKEFSQVDLFTGEDLMNQLLTKSESNFNLDFSIKESNLTNLNIMDDSMFDQGSGRESSDDDDVSDKSKKSSVKRKILKKSEVSNPVKITSKWDSNRSLRYNQDMQREEDQRRLKDINAQLVKLRSDSDKFEKQKSREYNGGIFSRLETQWKLNNSPPTKGSLAMRVRPKINQLPMSR